MATIVVAAAVLSFHSIGLFFSLPEEGRENTAAF